MRTAAKSRTVVQTARPKEVSTVPQASQPAPFSSLSRLIQSPKRARTTKPNNGRRRMPMGRTVSSLWSSYTAYPFIRWKASRSRVSRCRWSAITMPRPTAASAAATTITKKTRTCPSRVP